MRAINSFNSIFNRIGHRNATIVSAYFPLNFIRKSTPEDTGKLPQCRILYLVCVKISIDQFYEPERLKVSRVRALQQWSGIVLQLVIEKFLIINFFESIARAIFRENIQSYKSQWQRYFSDIHTFILYGPPITLTYSTLFLADSSPGLETEVSQNVSHLNLYKMHK